MAATPLLIAEIRAGKRSLSLDLAEIAGECARDVGLPLVTDARTPRHFEGTPSLVLHAPVDVAAEQHPVWCLACRLACFCPDARVSVMVHSETGFAKVARNQRIVRTAS